MLPSLCPSFVSPFFAIPPYWLRTLAVSSQTASSPRLLKIGSHEIPPLSYYLFHNMQVFFLLIFYFIRNNCQLVLQHSFHVCVFILPSFSLQIFSLFFSVFKCKETDRIFRAICLFSHLFYNSVSIFPDGFSSKLFLKILQKRPVFPDLLAVRRRRIN